MSKQLIEEFIRTQAIILAPICPYLGEKIFELLNEKQSVFDLKNGWPLGERNLELEKDYDYLFSVCHAFRLKKDAFDNLQRKAGKNLKELQVNGTIYVAKEFPRK